MVDRAQRELRLASFTELQCEVERLLHDGYTPGGNWNLAQVCRHLDDWMRYPMDGFPPLPWPVACVLAVARTLVGRRLLNKTLRQGAMPPGKSTLPDTVHCCDAREDAQAAAEFLKTIERMAAFEGVPARSPLFGDMSNREAKQLQLIHCAHHLAYLHPAG
jgi:hypothetical protein